MRYKILLVLCFLSITACQSLPQNFDIKKLGTIERDVKYCTMNGVVLKMDIYYPITKEKQWPMIIYVHPGGWTSGTKSVGASLVDIQALQKAGFLLTSVEYRLAPMYKFPAMIEDVKCAVRFLRAHADEYNIDPERFGAIGASAGGHLVSLLGVTDNTSGFDVGEYLNYSSRVQAVVDIDGVADLTPPFTKTLFFDRNEVFGTFDDRDPIFAKASPVSYVTPDDPPFLIFQGEFDTTVPPQQAMRFFRHLQMEGIEAQLIVIENADHGFLSVNGNPIHPSLEEIRKRVLLFWEQTLK
ncbi:MAG TPA: alpha/beta hydrolase [Anaerolineales bacterium]|nr:alpha/beta hydrolase [Anaerolineales bacterium]HLO33326.1 alpha/beta hydrolase [Anaerolineales bacterium]